MEPTNMDQVKANGLNFQLAHWEGNGENVLGIHGLTANCRCFDCIAEALYPEHNLIAPDLRGRGFSDKPAEGYSLAHHCEDMEQIISELGLSPVVLMGHSLGAAISLKLASQKPELVKGIILIDGGGALSKEQHNHVLEGLRPTVERVGKVFDDFQEYVKPLKNAPTLQPWNEYLERYFWYETELTREGVKSRIKPGNIQEELANLAETNIQETYEKIRSPVLILRATLGMLKEDDLLLPEEVSRQMTEMISNARVVDVPDTNHYKIIFHPSRERDQAILSFLRDEL